MGREEGTLLNYAFLFPLLLHVFVSSYDILSRTSVICVTAFEMLLEQAASLLLLASSLFNTATANSPTGKITS